MGGRQVASATGRQMRGRVEFRACGWLFCRVSYSRLRSICHGMTALKCCVTGRLVDKTLVLGVHNPFIVIRYMYMYMYMFSWASRGRVGSECVSHSTKKKQWNAAEPLHQQRCTGAPPIRHLVNTSPEVVLTTSLLSHPCTHSCAPVIHAHASIVRSGPYARVVRSR